MMMLNKFYGDVAQLARASALQAEGWEFKSPRLHQEFATALDLCSKSRDNWSLLEKNMKHSNIRQL